ncbi:MAG TPA: hypothetical protein VL993_03125 [Stellaceae bacterium]|nr:hypothetical protein [Stellaceae bacterium]
MLMLNAPCDMRSARAASEIEPESMTARKCRNRLMSKENDLAPLSAH